MNKDMDKPIGSVFVSKDEKERMNNMNCDKPIATISPFRYMNKKKSAETTDDEYYDNSEDNEYDSSFQEGDFGSETLASENFQPPILKKQNDNNCNLSTSMPKNIIQNSAVVCSQNIIPNFTNNTELHNILTVEKNMQLIFSGYTMLLLNIKAKNTDLMSNRNNINYCDKINKNLSNVKIVADFIIKNIEIHRIDDLYVQYDIYYFDLVSWDNKKRIKIYSDDIENGKIIKAIESQSGEFRFLNKTSKVNDLVFQYIMKNGVKRNIIKPIKNGFYILSKKMYYYPGLREVNAKKCRKVLDDFVDWIKFQNNKEEVMFFITLHLCGLLRTPIKMIGYQFRKLVIINDDIDLYQKDILKKILLNQLQDTKIFALDTFKNIEEFSDFLFDSKDNVVILENVSDTNYQKGKNFTYIRKLTDVITDNEKVGDGNYCSEFEAVGVVLSKEYLKNIDKASCLNVHIPEIHDLLDYIIPILDEIVVSFLCNNLFNNMSLFKPESSHIEFKYARMEETAMTMLTSLKILDKVLQFYNVEYNFIDLMHDYIVEKLCESERMYTEDDVIECFIEEWNNLLISQDIVIIPGYKLHSVPDEINKKILFYHKKIDAVLVRPDIFNEAILEKLKLCFHSRFDETAIKDILDNNNILIINNGDKKYYKAKICDMESKNYYAVKNSILTDISKYKLPKDTGTNICLCNDDKRIKRTLLGRTDDGKPVYWSRGHEDIKNQHMFIAGKTGSGKTYFLLTLARRLYNENEKVIIMDCGVADSYTHKELLKVFDENFICNNVEHKNSMEEAINCKNKITIIKPENKRKIEKGIEYLFNYCSSTENTSIYLILEEIRNLSFDNDSIITSAICEGRKIGINIITTTQSLSGSGIQSRLEILTQSSLKIIFQLDTSVALGKAASLIDEEKKEFLKEEIKKLKRGCALIGGELENLDGEITEASYVVIGKNQSDLEKSST